MVSLINRAFQCRHAFRMTKRRTSKETRCHYEMNGRPVLAGPWPLTVKQKLSMFWHTLLSKDCLRSIHDSSTCKQLMEPLTIGKKTQNKTEKQKTKLNHEASFTSDSTEMTFCFTATSHYFYLQPTRVRHRGMGMGWGGGVVVEE